MLQAQPSGTELGLMKFSGECYYLPPGRGSNNGCLLALALLKSIRHKRVWLAVTLKNADGTGFNQHMSPSQ